MTIRKHILSYLTQIRESIGQPTFRTSDIQGLSFKGEDKFGRMLGSPSTYERTFRLLREGGYLDVRKIDNPKSRESRWEIRGDYA